MKTGKVILCAGCIIAFFVGLIYNISLVIK